MRIERGIPIPVIQQKQCPWSFLFDLSIGDSFPVDSERGRNAALMYAKHRGGCLVSRKLNGTGFRLWLVEPLVRKAVVP